MTDDELREFVRAEIRRSPTAALARRGGVIEPGRRITFGTGVVVFTASVNSAALAVAHGLGATPVLVLATEDGRPAGGLNGVMFATYGETGSSVTVQGHRPTGAITGSIGFGWIAIG